MTTLKRLEDTLRTLRGTPASRTQINMRFEYERALLEQGWQQATNVEIGSEWYKDHKRMYIQNGDRVYISFDGIRWHTLNAHARRNLLLHSQ